MFSDLLSQHGLGAAELMFISGVPDPLVYGLSVLLFGGWLGLAYMVRLLFTGQLCTGRELSEKNSRIEALEQALATRDEQVDSALGVMPEIAEVLRKFHAARADRSDSRNV